MKLSGINPRKWFERKNRQEEEENDNFVVIRETITNKMTTLAMFFMAAVLILYGLNNLHTIIWEDTDESWVSIFNTVADVLSHLGGYGDVPDIHISRFVRLPGSLMFIAGGLLIILDSRRNFVRSVGLYALSMGLSRILMVVPLLLSQEDVSNGVGWLIAILGINLVYSGYSMLSGSVRGKWGILIASGAYVFIYLLLIGMFMLIYRDEDFFTLMENILPLILSFMMYFVLLWLLDTDEIRYGDKISRHITILRSIDNTHRAACLLTFVPEDAKKIQSGEGWETFDHDNGPVEKELRVESESPTGITYVTIQKWYGDEHLYFTLSAYKDGTLTLAERFTVNSVRIDEKDHSIMYLMGGPGKIIVADVKKKVVVE